MDQLQIRREDADFANEICGHRSGQLQPKVIVDLSAEDENRNTAGETNRDWIGDEFDHRAQASESHDQEDNSSHDGADEEIAGAVLLADTVNDDDERTRRAADGDTRAAQSGNQEAG